VILDSREKKAQEGRKAAIFRYYKLCPYIFKLRTSDSRTETSKPKKTLST